MAFDERSQDRRASTRFLKILALCAVCIALNVTGSLLASAFSLPVYLDCLGTILASMLGGYVPGIAVGYFTNLIISVSDFTAMYYGIVNVLIEIFMLITLLAIMLVVNWKLTLIGMCILPFLLFILFRLKRVMRKRWQIVRMKTSNMNGYLHESLAGMRVTEAFVREDENLDTFKNVGDDIRHNWMRAIHINNAFWPALDITGTVGNFIYVHPWTQFFDLKGREDIPKSYGSHILMRNCDLVCTRKPYDIVEKPEEFELSDIVYENIRIDDRSQQQPPRR